MMSRVETHDMTCCENWEFDMDLFIDILSDHLNRRQTVVPENTDWDELIATAKKHEMAALLYFQCRNAIPDRYRSSLEQANNAALFYYANRIKEEQRIRDSLEDIECFTVKGSAVAAYYPQPYLRTMGDSDFVVKESDMEKVHETMLGKGYTCISVGDYKKKGMEIEIHRYLAYIAQINTRKLVDFFNSYWSYYHDGALDWSFHFLFILFHLRSHLIGSGVGLRQFADVAALTKYNSELNWNWITEKLKELEMWSFAQKVFALNCYWFQIQPPIEIREADQDFLLTATDQILKNGVFGFDDLSNRANRIAVGNQKEAPLIVGVLKRTFGVLFPKYQHMIRMPQYAFLKGRPYLLPAAWVYRGVYTIRHRGTERTKSVLAASFVSKETVDERKALFEKWGLKDNDEQ